MDPREFNPDASATGPAPGPAPTRDLEFTPGTLLLERFRIVRVIASGGMGTVYLAQDEKLGQSRAIKIARAGHARHLNPEAATALRVTHPNVCRVHEIHTLDTPGGPVDFLSMEFVEGETLAARLRRSGPMTGDEALAVALQICQGLAAAHDAGLLHRDLKTNNVLLDGASRRGVRAVVTDFGLAQEDDAAATVTAGAAGTPAYLAPERWAGQRASKASDIFALGIVIHEIYAVTRPETAGDPRGPRTVASSIPASVRSVIARCIDIDPVKRFESAHAVAEALSPPPVVRRKVSPLWWTIAAVLPLAVATYAWLRPVTPAARLAVFPMEGRGLSAADTDLLRGASFDLSLRLTRYRPKPLQLVVIPVEETGALASADVAVARQRLGATHVLRAVVTPVPGGFEVDARIVDAATGLSRSEFKSQVASNGIPSLAGLLTDTVAASFHLPRAAIVESVAPAAAGAYAAAMALLRTDTTKGSAAAAAFEQAIALDPESPLPRAGFAEAAYSAWRFTQDASWLARGREQLKVAQEKSPDSLAVHLAAGKLSMAPGFYERAKEEFERATQIDATSAEAWRGLASAYEGITGHDNEAASAYLKASEVQPSYYAPLADLCVFYRKLGQYAKAIDYCRKVTELAPGLFAGHLNLGAVLVDAARYDDAERELRLALSIDPKSRSVLNNLGGVYQYLGRDADAVANFKLARESGQDTAVLMLNLGDSYRRLGKTDDARSAYHRGLELARNVTAQNSHDAVYRAYLAYFLVRTGDVKSGLAELEQALAPDDMNKTVARRAILIFAAVGDDARALALLRAAPPDLASELRRQPDLAAFWKTPAAQAVFQSLNSKH